MAINIAPKSLDTDLSELMRDPQDKSSIRRAPKAIATFNYCKSLELTLSLFIETFLFFPAHFYFSVYSLIFPLQENSEG